MKRASLSPAVLAAAAVAAVIAAPAVAAADGVYVSEAFGGSDVGDQLAREVDGTAQLRLAAGYRSGRWAVEGWLGLALGSGAGAYSDAALVGAPCDCGEGYGGGHGALSGLFTYGVDVKHLRPLSRHVEVYLRGGLSYGHLDGEYQGRGLGVGAGLQVKGKVPAIGLLFWPLFFTDWGPKITAAAFVDAGSSFYRLHRGGIVGNGSIDARFESLMVGVAFGQDF